MNDDPKEFMTTSDCCGLVAILVTILPLLLWRGALLAYGWNNFVSPSVGVSLTTIQAAGICVVARLFAVFNSNPTESDNWKWLGKQVGLLVMITLVLLALVQMSTLWGGNL